MTTHEELTEFEGWIADSVQHAAPLLRTKSLVAADRRDDPTLFRDLAELGILGTFVPDSAGGLGASPLMVQALLRATGAELLPVGLLSGGVIAPFLLSAAEDEDELLGSIAAGSIRVTWADVTHSSRAEETRERVSANADKVLDADIADLFIVSAGSEENTQFYVIEADHALIDEREPLDPTRPALSVAFDAAPARLLRVANPTYVAEQVRLLLILGLAAESAGLAKATLDRSVSYATVREQFGRPIGSFQTIKHLCADMLVAAEGAAAGVELATRGWEERGSLSKFEVFSTASFAFKAAEDNARAMMQIHGGLAFTWEHEAHWYLKRATSTPLIADDVNDASVASLALDEDFDIVNSLFAN